MDFTSAELMDWRKELYREVHKLPHFAAFPPYTVLPEAKDFELVKKTIVSKIAFAIWHKNYKPEGCDLDTWKQAEDVWNFIRHMWFIEAEAAK